MSRVGLSGGWLSRRFSFFALSGALIFGLASTVAVGDHLTTEIKLTPGDGAASDLFGSSVSVNRSNIVVGAHFDDDNGSASGSAYVFRRDQLTFPQAQKLLASDGAGSDLFGVSVAVDEDVIVVGAHLDDDNGSDSGSAYVFRFDGMQWIEEQKLTAGDGAADDQFGFSVAVGADTIVVGAFGDDDNGTSSGSAYVFQYNGSAWVQAQKLTAGDGAADDFFGNSVSVDTDIIVVSAHGDDDSGSKSGSAYIFRLNGAMWVEEQKLTASDGATQDQFGFSVSAGGGTIAVGAFGDDDNGSSSGSAYVFRFDGAMWVEEQKLTPGDGAAFDQFGFRVGADGDTVVVGAQFDGDNGVFSGSAYVFLFEVTTWLEDQKLTASDGTVGDEFGRWVSVDGATVVIGALRDDDNGSDSGSAYVFDGEIKPTALAGSDQSIHASQTVFLDGSSSFDDDTATEDLVFAWSLVTLPAGSGTLLSAANTDSPSFATDLPGTYAIQLVVTDEVGLTSEPDEVLVSSTNLAPTADAGPDLGGVTDMVVNLDGTGSADPENDPLSFSWSFQSRPTGSTAILSDPNSATPSFIPDDAGEYVVDLVANDGFEDSAPDSVAVTVITGEEFAENETMEVMEFVAELPPAAVTTGGNQSAFCNFTAQAIQSIQGANLDRARRKLQDSISRTDGCALRGEPDGKGPGRDWITDCAAQLVVYEQLTTALAAISP